MNRVPVRRFERVVNDFDPVGIGRVAGRVPEATDDRVPRDDHFVRPQLAFERLRVRL